MPFPVSLSSRPSSFRAQREISLAQRSNGERQMRSSRSTHAILSLPHKCRVPLRRKRSLGYARDDDTRERAISHDFSSDHVEGCPCGADLSSAFGAPLLQGATPLTCKSAAPSATYRDYTMRIPLFSPRIKKPSPRGEGGERSEPDRVLAG